MRAEGSHTQRQWEGKFFRCGMECWYCRTPLTLEEATKDHLNPISRGGEDIISNIVPACIDCNRLKGPLTEDEFREERKRFSTGVREVSASRLPTSYPVPPQRILPLAQRDEPPLDKLRSEGEEVSWAWRNPK